MIKAQNLKAFDETSFRICIRLRIEDKSSSFFRRGTFKVTFYGNFSSYILLIGLFSMLSCSTHLVLSFSLKDGLVKANMEKLTFYALSAPEKLDRIGAYLSERLSRDVARHRYG